MGFTLVELLVTITIIAILAGLMMGALALARNSARESATRSTIAKLNRVIMERYESYMTRRVAISDPALNSADEVAEWNAPANFARRRLNVLRDIMRMEMPDCYQDFMDPPTNFPYTFSCTGRLVQYSSAHDPPLRSLYAATPLGSDNEAAQCLHMIVSMGSPEAMEQFGQLEIGTVTGTFGSYWQASHAYSLRAAVAPTTPNGHFYRCTVAGTSGGSEPIWPTNGTTVTDGAVTWKDMGSQSPRPVFVDGWGQPIAWLRWAPGFSNWHSQDLTWVAPDPRGPSEIQSGNVNYDSDPFDQRSVSTDPAFYPITTWYPSASVITIKPGFQFIPLICSAGRDGQFGLIGVEPRDPRLLSPNPYDSLALGQPYPTWQASQACSLGVVVVPTTSYVNGHSYRCTVAGTTGGTEPIWPTDGSTVSDGAVTWQDMAARAAFPGTHFDNIHNHQIETR